MTVIIVILYVYNNNIDIRKHNRKKCNKIDEIMLSININSYKLQKKIFDCMICKICCQIMQL